MNRLKNRFRLISILATAVVFAAASGLQPYQISCTTSAVLESCCSGCSCGQDETSPDDAFLMQSVCCCSISAPEAETDVPLEASLSSPTHPETSFAMVPATSFITESGTEPYQTPRIDQPSAHGPPLYLLNASFLI